ncbi:MAG: hypothetical protein ACRDNJ_02890 [Solirubrobacteraceae bacterium]
MSPATAHFAVTLLRGAGWDPWAQAELLAIGSIEPWELWLDFRTAAAT